MFALINQIATGTIRLIPQPKSEDYGHSLTEACFGYPSKGDTHSAGSDLIDRGKPQGMCVGSQSRIQQARKGMCVGGQRPGRTKGMCVGSERLQATTQKECVLEVFARAFR